MSSNLNLSQKKYGYFYLSRSATSAHVIYLSWLNASAAPYICLSKTRTLIEKILAYFSGGLFGVFQFYEQLPRSDHKRKGANVRPFFKSSVFYIIRNLLVFCIMWIFLLSVPLRKYANIAYFCRILFAFLERYVMSSFSLFKGGLHHLISTISRKYMCLRFSMLAVVNGDLLAVIRI